MNSSLTPLRWLVIAVIVIVAILTSLWLKGGLLKLTSTEPACLYGKHWYGNNRFTVFSFPVPFTKSVMELRPHEWGCEKQFQYDPNDTSKSNTIPPGVIPSN